jgi:hypothetical protein
VQNKNFATSVGSSFRFRIAIVCLSVDSILPQPEMTVVRTD